MKILKTEKLENLEPRHIQLASLIFLALAELLTMPMSTQIREPIQYLLITCTNVAAALFLSATLMKLAQVDHKRLFFVGLAVCGWFLIVELSEMRDMFVFTHSGPRFAMSTFFCEYAMCLPYASVEEKKDSGTGLKVMGGCFLASFLVVLVFAAGLYLGQIPEGWQRDIGWMGSRIMINQHPNLLACILLFCVGFSIAFAAAAPKLWQKALFILMTVIQFFLLMLTNCRAVIIMALCIVGGVIFFLIYRKVTRKNLVWKFGLGLIAAVLSIAVLFVGNSFLYRHHCEFMVKHSTEFQEEKAPEAAAAAERAMASMVLPKTHSKAAPMEEVSKEDAEAESARRELQHESGQRSFLKDINSMNGRTGIWVSAVRHIFEEPSVLLFGTRHVGEFAGLHNRFAVEHAHNSWLQALLSLGLVGFLFVLYLTWIAVKSSLQLLFFRESTMFQKVICMLVIAVMGAEFFEPYLFYTNHPYSFVNIGFLFCLGYVDLWAQETPRREYI